MMQSTEVKHVIRARTGVVVSNVPMLILSAVLYRSNNKLRSHSKTLQSNRNNLKHWQKPTFGTSQSNPPLPLVWNFKELLRDSSCADFYPISFLFDPTSCSLVYLKETKPKYQKEHVFTKQNNQTLKKKKHFHPFSSSLPLRGWVPPPRCHACSAASEPLAPGWWGIFVSHSREGGVRLFFLNKKSPCWVVFNWWFCLFLIFLKWKCRFCFIFPFTNRFFLRYPFLVFSCFGWFSIGFLGFMLLPLGFLGFRSLGFFNWWVLFVFFSEDVDFLTWWNTWWNFCMSYRSGCCLFLDLRLVWGSVVAFRRWGETGASGRWVWVKLLSTLPTVAKKRSWFGCFLGESFGKHGSS